MIITQIQIWQDANKNGSSNLANVNANSMISHYNNNNMESKGAEMTLVGANNNINGGISDGAANANKFGIFIAFFIVCFVGFVSNTIYSVKIKTKLCFVCLRKKKLLSCLLFGKGV